jgi:hypothetical protein
MKGDVDPTSKEVYDHYFFIVTKWNGNIKKKNLTEIKTLKWVTKKELNKFKFSCSLGELLKRI